MRMSVWVWQGHEDVCGCGRSMRMCVWVWQGHEDVCVGVAGALGCGCGGGGGSCH